MERQSRRQENIMKLITIRNLEHGTETKAYVPETITNTMDAMDWLWAQAQEEREKLGHYGLERKKYLEHCRKLCSVQDCNCKLLHEEDC